MGNCKIDYCNNEHAYERIRGEAIQVRKTKKEYDEKWNGEHPERRKAINRNNYLKNREKRLEWNRQNRRKHLYEYYIRNAEARGIEFQLSREEFWELANDVCCYCGSSDNVGVDRADNNIGYVIENCVPCCGMCNKMENKYSQDTFVEHCKRVAEYCG